MKTAALLALLAAPARAGLSPAARIDAVLRDVPGFEGVPMPARASIPAPRTPAAPAPDSIAPTGLWDALAAPDAATLAWLAQRIPGLDAASVRVLTADAAEPLFAAAVARGLTPLDFFTDPALRGREVYYVPQAEVAALFARYDLRVMTPPSGTTTKGKPFAMKALVFGAGRIDALYDVDGFKFRHPDFDGAEVALAGRVTERIQGPGDLTVEGVSVKHGLVHPRIERIVKISPTEGRIETNYGSRGRSSYPIRRR